MEFTQFTVAAEDFRKFNGDILIYCLIQSDEGFWECDKAIGNSLQKTYKLGDFSGKSGEQLIFYPENKGRGSEIQAKRIAIFGIGKIVKKTTSTDIREMLRKVGGGIAKLAENVKASQIMIRLPVLEKIDAAQVAECITEGVGLGDYRFLKYKKPDPEEKTYMGLREVVLSSDTNETLVYKGMRMGENAAKATCLARDMANEPANKWTPGNFASLAHVLAAKYAMKCRILEKKDMERLGMGGILAVNQGSSEPPKMVILEYRPKGKKHTLLLVGKGLTFDSGGISLKPAAGMEDMKYDMCGGAAVLAFMQAVGEEKPDMHIIAIIPATDNMSGSSAVKPGDVIHHYGGITSEIVNTDAEGRMILADALAYGIKIFKPDCVIDLATLTGAVIIGLGHHRTGLLSNNDRLVERLVDAGERCGEPLWRLPLGKDYTKQIESKVADIKNAGGKAGGTITAAAYLEKFVGETIWAHLDIAGTAWDFTEKPYIPKGPTGIGVRTLLELIRDWKEKTPTQGPV
jgi:leucyl aminopeptidase